MDIKSQSAGAAPSSLPSGAPVKTEWRSDVNVDPNKKAPKEESFGARLNRLSGVETQKSLYGEPKNQLSKDAYLKMMMEQIKYQDPFNPVKNEQFTQNMAMMGQLEQQINMNKNLEKMATQSQNTQIAALQLVGKNVLADRAAIYHEQEKFSPLQFKLPMDAAEVSIQVVSPTGETLRTLDLGAQSAGEVKTKWDGQDETGLPYPSGKYSYKISAKGLDGKEISVPTRVEGRVSGVTQLQGVTFLLVGDQRVALNDVEMIKEGEAAAALASASGPGAGVPTSGVPATPAPASPAAAAENKSGDSSASQKAPEVAISEDVIRALEEQEDSNPLEKPRISDSMKWFF